jgi:hypothetical protein
LEDYNPKTERPISGSLRLLMERERGRRIIVFDVGGTILLKDWLSLVGEWGSRVTIAGQTAPGDGRGARCHLEASADPYHDDAPQATTQSPRLTQEMRPYR